MVATGLVTPLRCDHGVGEATKMHGPDLQSLANVTFPLDACRIGHGVGVWLTRVRPRLPNSDWVSR